VPDLLALAPQNDPFYAGSPAQVAAAEWLANVLDRPAIPELFHLRRVHYVLVSAGDVVKPDGTRYENTEPDWTFLLNASRYARFLHLLDPRRLVDHRSPNPILYHPDGETVQRDPCAGLPPDWLFEPLGIVPPAELAQAPLDPPLVGGYDPDPADQRCYIAIFIEKSTMNDVLDPLARELSADVYPGAGFQSITTAVTALAKAKRLGKPLRAVFISDFDPAGAGMPVATARQLEFWAPVLAPGLDVALHHLALTRDQVDAFNLPRLPIKETDRRRVNFEELHGEGAVELDALEAVHPGALEQMVREAVEPYLDATLRRRLRNAEREAENLVRAAWESHVALRIYEIEKLRDELHQVSASVISRLETLQSEIRDTWHPPALPPRPEADAPETDESDWLFASGRDYLDQLAYYRGRRESA